MKILLALLLGSALPLTAAAADIREQCQQWALDDEVSEAYLATYIADCVASFEEEEEEEPAWQQEEEEFDQPEAEDSGDAWHSD